MKITIFSAVCAIILLSQFGSVNISYASEKNPSEVTSSIADYTGHMDGQTYINETFGFKIDVSDPWSVEQAPREALEDLFDFDFSSVFEEFTFVDSTSGNSIHATITTDPSAGLLSVLYKDYYTALENTDMLDNLKETMESSEMFSDIAIQIKEATILGELSKCIDVSSKLNNMYDLYQKQILFIKDDIVFTITISSFIEDHTQEIINLIQKI